MSTKIYFRNCRTIVNEINFDIETVDIFSQSENISEELQCKRNKLKRVSIWSKDYFSACKNCDLKVFCVPKTYSVTTKPIFLFLESEIK